MNTSLVATIVFGVWLVVVFPTGSVEGANGAQECLQGNDTCKDRLNNCTVVDEENDYYEIFCCPKEIENFTITLQQGNGNKFENCKCVHGEAVGKRCNSNTANVLSASFLTCAMVIFLGLSWKAGGVDDI